MKIKSSAPGRICLFGEHQDYLGFPVIAAAINLRVSINGDVSPGDHIRVYLTNIKRTIQFNSKTLTYTNTKDYLRSAVKVLQENGLYTPKTITAILEGTIPIGGGTSSSAALSTAWIGFLLETNANRDNEDRHLTKAEIAELAYLTEVVEFNESGGKMDQYTAALGGIIYLDFTPTPTITTLPVSISQFVLGDSRQPKDTQKSLKQGRLAQEEALRLLSPYTGHKNNKEITYEEAIPFLSKIPAEYHPFLQAALNNHQITRQAKLLMEKENPDSLQIASLMNQHHQLLRDNLKISTPKIERMIEKAMEAGALAAKINGSGGGGCMFALCPGKQQEVADAIRQAGGIPHIIHIDSGLQVSTI